MAAFVNYIRRTVSERTAWGWTTLAMLLTKFLVCLRDGEKTASGKRCGGADRRGKPDTAGEPETRNYRKHGQLRSCGRRQGLTSGQGWVRRKGLAPQAGLEPATLRLTAGCKLFLYVVNGFLVRQRTRGNRVQFLQSP